MTFPSDVLRDHLLYTAWASRRLVEAAAQLSPDELTRDFATADRSVLGTLMHLFNSDRLWLARLERAPQPAITPEAGYHLAILQEDWPALHQRWHEWAAGITDETAAALVTYHDLKGREWTQPLWQLILHVVNHGTHHRGQATGFIRTLGHTPPPLDLVAYYRIQLIGAAGQ